jgi:hypothetical protein
MPAGRPRIVSYDGKWNRDSVEYQATRPVRALVSARTRARCEQAALAAVAALELRDYARVDLRVDPSGAPFVIDVNPNCDLSDGAGVSRAASFGGLAYPDLIERICEAALARYRNRKRVPHVDQGRSPAAPVPGAARAAALAVEGAAPAPGQGERPRRARAAGVHGRAVHGGGGGGRARAHRRRAR